MKDRIPKDPGRVLISPENGSASFYATMTRADNPEQEGTPLNKNSLLKDTTAALFGLDDSAVPDDVLAAIKSILNTHAQDIAAGTKVVTGSYAGTDGTSKTLTFDGKPMFVVVLANQAKYANRLAQAILIRGGGIWYLEMSDTTCTAKASWTDNSVTITDSLGGLFFANFTYSYLAITI